MYTTVFRLPAGTQAVVDTELLRSSPDVMRRAAAAEDGRVAAEWLPRGCTTWPIACSASSTRSPTARPSACASGSPRHLLDLASRDVGAAGGGSPVLTVRVSQRDLAQPVGSAREVVVRVLRDLRESGVITTTPITSRSSTRPG